jgi:hypothetical protein
METKTKAKIFGILAGAIFIGMWVFLRGISRGADGTYTKFVNSPTSIIVLSFGFLILTIIVLISNHKSKIKYNQKEIKKEI